MYSKTSIFKRRTDEQIILEISIRVYQIKCQSKTSLKVMMVNALKVIKVSNFHQKQQ